MRIGIYFTSQKTHGGVYQYSIAILESFFKIRGNEYVIFSTSPDVPEKYKKSSRFKMIKVSTKTRSTGLKIRNFVSGPLQVVSSLFTEFLYRLILFNLLTPLYKLSQFGIIENIEKEKPDLMFYPTSSNLSFLTNIPAIVTVHDLQHRINPKFKEVSAGGRWEYREYGFINVSKTAFKILVDSRKGRDDMEIYYPDSRGKVVVLPYLPPSYLNPEIDREYVQKVTRKYSLPERFIFYPSKFWPHKNHKNLVRAIFKLKKEGKRINLVLSGSREADFSSFKEVVSLIHELKLDDQIFYLGYVSNKELSALYKKAMAMVMPTYFGPTNIPVLEAWLMGTPVIYSDIPGCRRQLGKAGLLINPDDPSDIAEKIDRVYTSSKLRIKLKRLGKKRVRNWTKNDFTAKIEEIIKEFFKDNGHNNNKT